MSLIENTSLDMASLEEPVNSLIFVKEPNVQQPVENREIPKAMIFAPITPEHVGNIQQYLKDNNDVNLLINEKYTGPVDGKINEELENIVGKLEFEISKTINKNVGKIVLSTTVKDIDSAIKIVLAYKKINSKNQEKTSQDQRFYELGKMLFLKNKK